MTEPSHKEMLEALVKTHSLGDYARGLVISIQTKIADGQRIADLSLGEVTELERVYYHYRGH